MKILAVNKRVAELDENQRRTVGTVHPEIHEKEQSVVKEIYIDYGEGDYHLQPRDEITRRWKKPVWKGEIMERGKHEIGFKATDLQNLSAVGVEEQTSVHDERMKTVRVGINR